MRSSKVLKKAFISFFTIMTVACQALPVYAAGDPNVPAEPADTEKIYTITSDQAALPFGEVETDTTPAAKAFKITNTGNDELDFSYTETDADDAFTITEGKTHLAKGASTSYSITPNMSNLVAGKTYSAQYSFMPDETGGTVSGFVLEATITVTPKKTPSAITGITVEPGSGSVAAGELYKLTATVAGTGSYSSDVIWSISGNKSANTYITTDASKRGSLYVSDDELASAITVIAKSVQDPTVSGYATLTIADDTVSLTLKASPLAGGNVTGSGTYNRRTSPVIKATPNTGYVFKAWKKGTEVVSTEAYCEYENITTDTTLTAVFEIAKYTIDVTPNKTAYGSVTGGGSYEYGSVAILTATAKSGYKFSYWKEDDRIIGYDETLRIKDIKADRVILAYFEEADHRITVNCTPEGVGDITGEGSYKHGESVTLKAEPDDGYKFSGWIYNGSVVTTEKRYKIDKITQDMTFTAKFRKSDNEYTIKASIEDDDDDHTQGTITPSGTVKVKEGSNVSYTITPGSGYKIDKVIVDGNYTTNNSTYTFNKVDGDHTIKVVFVRSSSASSSVTKTSTSAAKTTATPTPAKTTTAAATTAKTTQSSETAKSSTSTTTSKKSTAATAAKTTKKTGSTSDDDEESELEKQARLEAEARQKQALEEKYAAYDEMIKKKKEEKQAEEEAEEKESILSSNHMTEEVAKSNIQNGEDAELIKQAYDQGFFKINVFNSYGNASENNFDGNANMPALGTVMSKLLTEDEKLRIFNGETAVINVSIRENTSFASEETKSLFKETGSKPVQYFDFSISKSVDKEYTDVTFLPEELTVTLNIPESVKSKNAKEYVILRQHLGEIEKLEDIDNDPNTITFKTDAFSQYAIASAGSGLQLKGSQMIGLIIIFIIVVLIIAATEIVLKNVKK